MSPEERPTVQDGLISTEEAHEADAALAFLRLHGFIHPIDCACATCLPSVYLTEARRVLLAPTPMDDMRAMTERLLDDSDPINKPSKGRK